MVLQQSRRISSVAFDGRNKTLHYVFILNDHYHFRLYFFPERIFLSSQAEMFLPGTEGLSPLSPFRGLILGVVSYNGTGLNVTRAVQQTLALAFLGI